MRRIVKFVLASPRNPQESPESMQESLHPISLPFVAAISAKLNLITDNMISQLDLEQSDTVQYPAYRCVAPFATLVCVKPCFTSWFMIFGHLFENICKEAAFCQSTVHEYILLFEHFITHCLYTNLHCYVAAMRCSILLLSLICVTCTSLSPIFARCPCTCNVLCFTSCWKWIFKVFLW